MKEGEPKSTTKNCFRRFIRRPATDIDQLGKHLDRADQEKLKQVLKQVQETISDPDFEDAFKGVFQQQELPEDNIKKIQEFIQNQVG